MNPVAYNPTIKTLHWLMALLIIGLWVLGQVMGELPKGDFRGQVFGWHKELGVVILILVSLRLAWRLGAGVPALPDTMQGRERTAAHAGHILLYVLMILLPIDGILLSQSGGRAVMLAGWQLPTLIGKNEGLHEVFEAAHGIMAWGLAILLLGHVGAALRHHYILRDNVLTRMLPGRD
ncbi:putative Cytochrome B561 [Magnetospirillum sp. LM-5]|uniref:cytochrome b n=1 Tax=Magnetospirillum sp. LM-5 TaxID=2681466 RepID=UPI001380775F|nr:cytochrome b [Magnetospirillum sp. LM-5]CAA7617648.1 putative Cytochrome B561 [Magnetospirillum sp. LM-5]